MCIHICICRQMCICRYESMSAENVLGDQRCWIPLEAELQVVVNCLMRVLETQLWPSGRAARACNC